LDQELRKKDDPRLFRWLPLLHSLGQERHAEFVGEGLLSLGDQFRDEGYLDLAASAYSAGKSLGGNDIGRWAEEKLQVLKGGGTFGARFEFLAPRLAKETLNLGLLAPMLATSLLGRTVGTALFGRLTGVARSAWWSRGMGAEFLAGLGSYAAELPLFAGLSRLLAAHPKDSSGDWKHAALMLGTMKVFNRLGDFGVRQWIAARRPLTAGIQQLAHSSTTFSSLLATRQLEEHLQLRPRVEGTVGWIDALAETLSLSLGSSLGFAFLGPVFGGVRLEREMRARPRAEMAFSTVGSPPLRTKSSPSRPGEKFFMVESGGSERGGAPGGKQPVTVEEKRLAYRSFSETARVNLGTWLGRILKKNRASRAEIEEATAILWGDSRSLEKGLAEMDWVETHRLHGAIPQLRSYLQKDRDHRTRALQVLTTFKAPKPLPLPELIHLLEPYLDNRLELNKGQILEIEAILHAMTVLGVPNNLLRNLGQPYLHLLRGHHHREVSTAAEAASLQLGLIPQVPDYRPMLTSSQLELRLSALSILRATYDLPGSRAHRPQVEELLISDPDPKVRILAAETLARRRRKQEVILLGDVMKEDDHPKVQRAAADLLTEFRSPLAYPDLIAVLKNISSPPIVVESALNALGKLRARAALDQLRFFSKDPKPELRIAAAVALAQCGDIAAAVPIFREEFAQVHYLSRHMQILQGIAGLKRAQGRALLKKFAEEPVHPLLAITEHPNLWLSATALRVLDAFQRGWDADLLQLWEQIK
jgi:hypothetical protein